MTIASIMRNSRQYEGLYMCTGVLIFIVLVTFTQFIEVNTQQNWGGDWRPPEWNPWRPPWNNFEPYVITRTYFGDVKGITIPWHFEDEFWREDPGPDPPIGEYPPWFMRRINCYLGVPYAAPPIGNLRFQRPRAPRWGGVWDATYFRDACPQMPEEIRKTIPDFPMANISEDCLYMNIFVPNKTNPDLTPDREIYPVVVFFHGGDFIYGTSQQFPGHVLATRDVVVVTVNYRLGALGFLTTEDKHAQGNWGLFDQHMALEFIRQNIRAFRGDPNQVTIMGDGAGAASVGYHLLSPMSRGKHFYQQCIMMSGTDQSSSFYIDAFWRPAEYAHRLAEELGCPTHHSYDMMECLRDNKTKTWRSIVDAQHRIRAHDGAFGRVWGPTQDGGYVGSQGNNIMAFLPMSPSDMRRVLPKDNTIGFNFVPCIIGIETQAGAKLANESVRFDRDGGLFRESFQNFVLELMKSWKIIDVYQQRARDAIEFQYTYWPDPENKTARGQEFINMVTDIEYGQPMDFVVKQQSETENVFMYQFNFNSWNTWIPAWMGVSHSQALPYVLGFPFLNETILNETEMIPQQWFDYEDRNMSNWMMYMWTNFIKHGDPTPNITRNLTWGPFNHYNLSYLKLDYHSHMWYRYRQHQYGFWYDYFPSYAKQDFFIPTATPTPAGFEYVIATGSMSILLIILICGVVLLAYLLWYQSQQEDPGGTYKAPLNTRTEEVPLSFLPQTHGGSQANLMQKPSIPVRRPHHEVQEETGTSFLPQTYVHSRSASQSTDASKQFNPGQYKPGFLDDSQYSGQSGYSGPPQYSANKYQEPNEPISFLPQSHNRSGQHINLSSRHARAYPQHSVV